MASHLPAMISERDGKIAIDMHMAKNNPQWQEFFDDEVLVVFQGPHAYVSPRWYEDRERVPKIQGLLNECMTFLDDELSVITGPYEDLLSIDGFIRTAGGEPLLDGKLAIASLNRGGLAGSSWELDDPVTGPSMAACLDWRLDGVKLLLRLDPGEPSSLKTLLACAHSVSAASAHALPVFLEPLPVIRTDKGYAVEKTPAALARLAGVASALGDTSRYVWLKLPYCHDYAAVARSTTLPILLLGGESAGDPAPFFRQMKSALAAGPNVRGALVGRNVLYPGDEDPLAVAEAAGGIIHDGWSVEEALASLAASRGRDMDRLSRFY